MTFPLTVIDGNFNAPVEIEGSPIISLDEITYSMIVTRRFAVLKTAYVPLAQGVSDYLYKSAILITEQTESVEGPIMKFRRVYAQIPNTRIERRQIAFTFPGTPKVYFSAKTGLPIGWDKYGTSAPVNRLVVATVFYSYSIDPPPVYAALTKITFNGQEVDYAGTVYDPVGDVTILGNQTEPRYVFAGFTSPLIAPTIWTVSTSSRRWMGRIWETETVTLLGIY